ncbi:MAG TPA: hypothetical protein VFW40_10485, partial [Capsulimonadaceae bacterium]|nr:hypothetical protein [Capsulimonadaceae bacterium]
MRSFRIAQIVSLLAVFFAASTAYGIPIEGVLHPFPASAGDGSGPRAAVIQGSDGFLYGTTNQ